VSRVTELFSSTSTNPDRRRGTGTITSAAV
jgi:hypothetical protein